MAIIVEVMYYRNAVQKRAKFPLGAKRGRRGVVFVSQSQSVIEMLRWSKLGCPWRDISSLDEGNALSQYSMAG